MWSHILTLTGIALLICSASTRNIKVGQNGGRLFSEQPLRENGSLSHSPGTRDIDESELNKLLPYEALENTDVKERQLLPNEIMRQYNSFKKKSRNKNYFTLLDRLNTSRVRREIASEKKHTVYRFEGNASKNGNLQSWEQNLISDRRNANIPSVLHFYKAARANFTANKQELSDRFAKSIHHSLPKGSEDGQGFWGSLFYRNDKRRQFSSASGLNEEERKLLIGGEACLWGEYIDNNNILQTLWPRASAVAERLWSAKGVTNVTEAEPRFEEHHCRMLRYGIPASPNSGPSTCFV